MKVDPRALAGIEAKITRANEHFGRLHTEMVAWQNSDPEGVPPWRLAPEVHDNGRKHFFRLKLLTPIPVEWAVILGEAVHDLRSALDQAVYWLAVDWSRNPVDGSAFPVCTTGRNFRHWSKKRKAWRGGFQKIEGIGPGPYAFIEALQPYPQRYRRFYCRDLRTVHDLWNQDKHRLVHLWGIRFREPKRLRPPTYVERATLDRRVLHDDAVVLRVFCRSPQPKVQMVGEIGADLAFSSGKRRGGANEILWDTASTVADIVRKLVNAVGQQERPISLDIWTAKGQ